MKNVLFTKAIETNETHFMSDARFLEALMFLRYFNQNDSLHAFFAFSKQYLRPDASEDIPVS
jgi:hypothetical protein